MDLKANGKQPKKLRMFDMILFSVCAMLLLSQLTLSAAIGTSSVFWTVALIVVFFIPYGLITSELGSTYPDSGGLGVGLGIDLVPALVVTGVPRM